MPIPSNSFNKKKMVIPCYNQICLTPSGAFKNSVVRRIFQNNTTR